MKLAIHLFVTIVVLAIVITILYLIPPHITNSMLTCVGAFYIGWHIIPPIVDKILKILKLK